MQAGFWYLRRLEPLAPIPVAAAAAACVTLLAYATGPLIPLVVAAGVAVVAAILMRPMLGLYSAVALVPLEFVSVPVGAGGISPAEGVFVLTAASWVVTRMANRERPYVPNALGGPFFLLVVALVPGVAVAPDPVVVMKTLVLWTCFLVVYLMLVTDGDRETVKRLLLILAGAAAIIGAEAALGVGGRQELVGAGEHALGRASGPFGSPNAFATFQALALPGALALALAGKPSWRPFALAAFVLIIAGVALSLSRGGLLAVAGALIVMLAWRPFRLAAVAAALLVLGISVAAGAPLGENQQVSLVSKRVESITYSAQGSDYRLLIWKKTPEIVADYPLFGVGANVFPTVAPSYGLVGYNSTATFLHAHNIPLTFAVELGLVGLAALLWATVALAGALYAGYRRNTGGDRGLVLALVAAFVALVLQGMVDYTLRANVIVAVVMVLAGCAVVLSRKPGAA